MKLKINIWRNVLKATLGSLLLSGYFAFIQKNFLVFIIFFVMIFLPLLGANILIDAFYEIKKLNKSSKRNI